jgi:hypothetical protein
MAVVDVKFIQVILVYVMVFDQIKTENLLDSKMRRKSVLKKKFNINFVHIFKCTYRIVTYRPLYALI